MQKFKEWLEKHGFYLRVFLYSLSFFIAIKVFVFSREKDPELMIYFNKNLNIINHYCTKEQYKYPFMTSVVFDKMEIAGAIAYCDVKLNGFKLAFDRHYWDNLSDLNKTQLMLHEMAHCMFDEEHRNDPAHFMYPAMNEIDGLSLAIQIHGYFTQKCGERRE